MGDRAEELDDVKCVIRALLIVNKRPAKYATLMKIYRRQEGCPIPYAKFGFSSCMSFLESLHDAVRVRRTKRGVFISARLEESAREAHTSAQAQKAREPAPRAVHERPSRPELPDHVLQNILKLMDERDVPARVLKDTYQQHFGEPLDVEQYGFKSVEQCLARVRPLTESERNMPEAITAVLAQYPDGIYLSRFAEAFARERGRPPALGTIDLVRRWAELFRLSKPDYTGEYILQPASDSTVVLRPPEALAPLSSVSVTNVCGGLSVLTVALQASGSESLLALLEAEMDHFYGSEDFGPRFDAEPGRPCAALCTESWQRARVVSLSGGVVQVELVDVGGSRSLEEQQLRPLAPRFTELPELCTVATLTPPLGEREWREAAAERLRELTQGRRLTCVLDGSRFDLQDEHGLSLTRRLASEGLCKPAWRCVKLSRDVSFNVVWLEEERYISSFDLSRLLGQEGDSALEELQRRRIRFGRCVRLDRDTESWRILEPLFRSMTGEVWLFPVDNIPDAVNLLRFPHNEVGVEVKRELDRLQAN